MSLRLLLGVLDPLVGVWLVVSGVLGWARRPASRAGLLMMSAGAAWLAGAVVPGAAFVHRGPLVHLHLSYPSGRLRRRAAVAVTAAVYAVALVEGVVRVPWVTLGLSAGVGAVAVDTFTPTTGAARKAALPALVAALGFAGVLALSSLNRIFGWELDGPVAVGYDVVIMLAVAVLLADLLTGRWVDAAVTDLVLELGSRAGVTGLRRQLRRALGDPTLELGVWLPGPDLYVDESGRPVEVPAASDQERTTTRLDDADGPVAVLVHDPVALHDPALLDAVAAAASLAVANTRMQSDIEARAAELTATRRRIVEAADLERRRLVDDLQDGASARLLAVDSILARVGPRGPGARDELLRQVRAELRAAVDEVHALAQGIRPPALTTGGLAVAVPMLAARAGFPVTTDITVGRLPAAEEAALYFVCAEGLANAAKHSRAAQAWIGISETGGLVTAEVTDDGVGGADRWGSGLQGLVDRVHAVGGALELADHVPHGTRLTVRLRHGRDTVGASEGAV